MTTALFTLAAAAVLVLILACWRADVLAARRWNERRRFRRMCVAQFDVWNLN